MATVDYSERMDVEEYVRLRNKVGFTGRGFARWLGHAERAERMWSGGERRVPNGVAVLLRLLVKLKIDADKAAELVPPR